MWALATIYRLATLDGIRPGLEGRLERVVEGELITRHVGGAGTLATPAMIGLMEITSHRAVEHLLPDGHTTVGYEVHVRHLAPAAPEPCPVCRGPMKNKGDFYSCARYPDCKGSIDVKALAKAKKAGKTCPKCQRLLVEKKSPKGKFWGCSGYPECKHIENTKAQKT